MPIASPCVRELRRLGPDLEVTWERRNDRLTFTVAPVTDPRAFADRITFASVVGVVGRRIDGKFGSDR